MTNHLGSAVMREKFMEKPEATSAIVNPAQSRAIRSPEGKPWAQETGVCSAKVKPGLHEVDKVEKLNPKDIEKAAYIITEAFMDYPLPGQYIEDPDRRRTALREMFKVELRKALDKGSVYTLGGDFQEVAIWKHEVMPESDLVYIKYMRLDTLKLLFTVRIKECIRLFRALRNIMDTKLKLYLPENTVELYIVGVNPANQGQGRLSKLLKPVLKAVQEENKPALVMTNTDSNRKIYEHLGFELVEVLNDHDNDITAYYLVKYPYP